MSPADKPAKPADPQAAPTSLGELFGAARRERIRWTALEEALALAIELPSKLTDLQNQLTALQHEIGHAEDAKLKSQAAAAAAKQRAVDAEAAAAERIRTAEDSSKQVLAIVAAKTDEARAVAEKTLEEHRNAASQAATDLKAEIDRRRREATAELERLRGEVRNLTTARDTLMSQLQTLKAGIPA